MAIYADGTDQSTADATSGKTTEEVQDDVASMLTPGNNVGMEYRDSKNEYEVSAKTGGGASYSGEFSPFSRFKTVPVGTLYKDTIVYNRIFLPEKTIDRAGIFTLEQKTGGFAMGIYDSNSNGVPDTLVADTGVTSTTTDTNGWNYFNFTSSFTPASADTFWIVYLANINPSTYRTNKQVNQNNSLPGTVSDADNIFHPVLTESRQTSNGLVGTASPNISVINPHFVAVFTA